MRDWSNCSAAYLQQNLRFGLKSCLLNIPDPSTVYGGPECGNEILEQGEECDCGTPETCPRYAAGRLVPFRSWWSNTEITFVGLFNEFPVLLLSI